MRIRSWSWLALVLSSLALPALAQTQPANTVRTLLAAGHLGSVVDTPLYFRLFAVRLPAMEHVPYSGPNSVLYVLSGTLTVALDGTTQTVSEGAGVFIPAVRTTVFGATGIEPPRSRGAEVPARGSRQFGRVVSHARAVAGPEGRTSRIQPHPGHLAGGHAGQPSALSIGRGFVLRYRWHWGCHGGWEGRT